jgi:tetratricopeptide (TPR) repeat protein
MKLLLACLFVFYSWVTLAQKNLYDQAINEFHKGNSLSSLELARKIDGSFIHRLSKNQQITCYLEIAKIFEANRNFPEAITNLLLAKKIKITDAISNQLHGACDIELGLIFSEIGAKNIAIEFIKKGLRTTSSPQGQFYHTNTLGALYFQINETDSALVYFRKQLGVSKNLFANAYSSANNNIGLALLQIKNHKDALRHFIIAEKECDSTNDHEFYFSIQGNLGTCYSELNNTTKTISHLENYTKYKGNQFLVSGRKEYILVQQYLKIGKIDAAIIIKNRLTPFFSKMNTIAKIDYLKIQYAILFYEKQYQRANLAFDSIEVYRKLYEIQNITYVNYANDIVANFMILESKSKLKNLEKEKTLSQTALILAKKESYFALFIVSSVALFIITFSVLSFHIDKNKKKKLALEKEILLFEDEKHKLKIIKQENNLTNFAIEFNRKKVQNKETIAGLNSLMHFEDAELRVEIKRLILHLKNQASLDKNSEELNTESELLLLNFKDNLLDKHENLSKAEIELCCMLKLSLSNKEIATFKNYSDNSIKTLKTRLKKKLNLKSNEILSHYLDSLV